MMKQIYLRHTASFAVVLLVSILLLSLLDSHQKETEVRAIRLITSLLPLDSLDLTDPLEAALAREAVQSFYPNQQSKVDSLISELEAYKVRRLTDPRFKSGQQEQGISLNKIGRLIWMYVQFIAVFTVVMVLTYFGARVAAIFKFFRVKQGKNSYLGQLIYLVRGLTYGANRQQRARRIFTLLCKSCLKGIASVVLFSPAYVIAYTLKTEVDTGSQGFMVILAVISNGLLISLTNKFYTFLVHESRKGYVETATVKGLDTVYSLPAQWAQRVLAVTLPLRIYSNHVFKHIYVNARFQFIPSVKEHAAFLVSGLMIIEMALNLQGHLCYELLQCMLFRITRLRRQ